MTAKDAVRLAHDSGKDHRDEIKNNFILKAKLRELQEFIHGISAHVDNVYFNWAKTAVDIRIAKGPFLAHSHTGCADRDIGCVDGDSRSPHM